ncbi:MAG: hypothetical protein V3T96_00075 [Thermodesulfobacteriota bacterium]|jgi:nitrogen regulatory protein PII
MHKLIVAIIRHERLEKVLSVLKKERIGFTYHIQNCPTHCPTS